LEELPSDFSGLLVSLAFELHVLKLLHLAVLARELNKEPCHLHRSALAEAHLADEGLLQAFDGDVSDLVAGSLVSDSSEDELEHVLSLDMLDAEDKTELVEVVLHLIQRDKIHVLFFDDVLFLFKIILIVALALLAGADIDVEVNLAVLANQFDLLPDLLSHFQLGLSFVNELNLYLVTLLHLKRFFDDQIKLFQGINLDSKELLSEPVGEQLLSISMGLLGGDQSEDDIQLSVVVLLLLAISRVVVILVHR